MQGCRDGYYTVTVTSCSGSGCGRCYAFLVRGLVRWCGSQRLPRGEDGDGNEQGWRRRFKEHALLLVLRQEPARSAQTHCRADRLYLRRMRRTVHGYHSRGEQILAGEVT